MDKAVNLHKAIILVEGENICTISSLTKEGLDKFVEDYLNLYDKGKIIVMDKYKPGEEINLEVYLHMKEYLKLLMEQRDA